MDAVECGTGRRGGGRAAAQLPPPEARFESKLVECFRHTLRTRRDAVLRFRPGGKQPIDEETLLVGHPDGGLERVELRSSPDCMSRFVRWRCEQLTLRVGDIVDDALREKCPLREPVFTCDESTTNHWVMSSPREASELPDAGGPFVDRSQARICFRRDDELNCVLEAEWWALFPPDAGVH